MVKSKSAVIMDQIALQVGKMVVGRILMYLWNFAHISLDTHPICMKSVPMERRVKILQLSCRPQKLN